MKNVLWKSPIDMRNLEAHVRQIEMCLTCCGKISFERLNSIRFTEASKKCEAMNIELEFLLIQGLIFVPTAIFILSRLAHWIAGRKLIPLWLLLTLIAVALAGGSLYLKSAGVITPVKIIEKIDEVSFRNNGSWNRRLTIRGEYKPPGETSSLPITLRCDGETFEALREGQTVEARVLHSGPSFNVASLKERAILSFISERFPGSPKGPWREATAVVGDLTHVTEYSIGEEMVQLRWPFTTVQLSFTPEGRDRPVIAVDVVEAASAPDLMKGQTVRIRWPEDDPRSATIIGARPGAPWANWFYGIIETTGVGLVIIALFAITGFILQRRGMLKWRRKKCEVSSKK